ncbi:MAG: MoaD/ThiS family protein [Deltaproteobacteria bacterium]|jgi:molybdopterin converting factor small subunit|nr:MoaD/ThiS family protein [Deltaproteobacteria bacterium]MBW2399609.1 MoaD/ThiS family protein [Deltaproteobacteria bacterium]
MKVRVYAAGFCSFEHIDEEGFMNLPADASLNDVYKRLRIPLLLRKVVFAAVNYEQAKLATKLEDGDVVSLLGPLSGG